MATIAHSVQESPPLLPWFWEFLKEELAPSSGRAATVARMVISATLVMLICMTFRIPYAFQGSIYALIVSRENPRATLESAGIMSLVTGVSAAYILISAWFVISVPLLHFFWIIFTFFAAFYGLSTITNYLAVTMFANMISVAVPLWDRHVSAETKVEDTLWVALASSIGVVVTAVVELAFGRMKPGDNVVLPIEGRLAAVQSLLACYLEDRPVDRATEDTITRLAMLGTSSLRGALRRSDYSTHYRAQMNGVGALVGRLVDIAATLTQLRFEPSTADQRQLRNLAENVANIRAGLVNRRIPGLIQFNPRDEPSGAVPLLLEMEQTVALIPQVFAGSRSMDELVPPLEDTSRSKLLVPDALTNPEHLEFALKGCLAASLCYILYNAIAWPGISTAVTTCLLTGLSTIGASRQKQTLRFAGALVGGFLIGMGSQIFILPYLDSIAGFTVLFMLVTIPAAWIMASSPRLSYFGLQAALAFYLINLQEFTMQTSLAVARDRVVGILLGLFMMWVVFDQLWGAPAAVEMKKTFVSSLRLLAQLEREPLPGEKRLAIQRGYSLRETINSYFDRVRSLADGVLFEFGPSRQQGLLWRVRIVRWQPQVRILFLTRIALWRYRAQLPGFELPEAIQAAQQEFDYELAGRLDQIADRVDSKAKSEEEITQNLLAALERTIQTHCSEENNPSLAPQCQALLRLCRTAESLTISLDKELRVSQAPLVRAD